MRRHALRRSRYARVLVVAAWASIVVGVSASAAQQATSMSADMPPGSSPGDVVTLTGNVAGACEPGTAEVGFSPRPEFFSNVGGSGDPRQGDEIVIYRPTVPPGNNYSTQVVLPDPGVRSPTFYALCKQRDVPFDSYIGSSGTYVLGDRAAGPRPGASPPVTGRPGPTEPSASRAPAVVGGIVLALALAAAAALVTRAMRRSRSSRERMSSHQSCLVRHDAVAKAETSARAGVRQAVSRERARATEALDDLEGALASAADVFDVLLAERDIVDAAIDDVLRDLAGGHR